MALLQFQDLKTGVKCHRYCFNELYVNFLIVLNIYAEENQCGIGRQFILHLRDPFITVDMPGIQIG